MRDMRSTYAIFQEFANFWPGRQVTLEAENVRIKLIEETRSHGLDVKDFNLSGARESYEVAVKVMFFNGWPSSSPSSSPGSRKLSDLVRVAHGIHKQASIPVGWVGCMYVQSAYVGFNCGNG